MKKISRNKQNKNKSSKKLKKPTTKKSKKKLKTLTTKKSKTHETKKSSKKLKTLIYKHTTRSDIDYSLFNKIYNKCSNIDMLTKYITNTFGKTLTPVIKYDQLVDKIPYEHCSAQKLGLHIGQRKLFLSELQFLTANRQKYCIYPGAAPGHKTHFLSVLFPDVKFILVDPNVFGLVLADKKTSFRNIPHDDIIMIYYHEPTKSNIYKDNKSISKMSEQDINNMLDFIRSSTYKIFIIEDYMTQVLANILSKIGECSFMEDIRSNVTGNGPSDIDIVWNRCMVHNWITTIKPEVSMVKFRVPYFNKPEDLLAFDFTKVDFEHSKTLEDGSIDFIQDYNKKIFKYSKCDIYMQAWEGSSSTEMRGWIYKDDITNIITYDCNDIESKLFHYNLVYRVNYHSNPYADKKIGICHCNDCCIECDIWNNYDNKKPISHYVRILDNITSRPLKYKHTQCIYKPLDIWTYKQTDSISANQRVH